MRANVVALVPPKGAIREIKRGASVRPFAGAARLAAHLIELEFATRAQDRVASPDGLATSERKRWFNTSSSADDNNEDANSAGGANRAGSSAGGDSSASDGNNEGANNDGGANNGGANNGVPIIARLNQLAMCRDEGQARQDGLRRGDWHERRSARRRLRRHSHSEAEQQGGWNVEEGFHRHWLCPWVFFPRSILTPPS